MKKKRLSIYVTMLGLAMATAPVFTSCEDMLEEKPYDFISPDDVPDSDDGADMWTTGVYETLHSSMFRYGNMPRPFDYDCDNVSGATWQFDQFGNGNFQGSNNHCDVVWTGMYSVINRANEAIEQINEMKNLTARHRDNVLGECYFLKAWAYFMLVRAYGDIPVYSVSVNQSQQYTNSPRIPIKDVYTQTIIPLLDDAKDMLYKNTDTNFQAGRVCAASAAGLLAKVYATIASAAMPKGEIVTVKTGPQFVMQNINGTNTKVYTEPVPMDFAKDQVAGYESFNSQEYYQLAYDVAKDVKDGVYGTHNLESYDLIWSPSGKTCSEHLFSLQSKSGDELYGTLFTYHYCGMTNEKGHIENSLTVGNSKHWYLLFEEDDYRVDKGVLHCWIREGSDTSWGGGSYFPNFGKWQEMVTNLESPFDNPVLTAEHAPLIWRYDFDEKTNPYMEERIGINATMNSGAIKLNGKYYLVVRVEGDDRKSFFAVAESDSPVDGFRFWDYPILMPETDIPDTNMYDMRLTAHEDGWIYGIFCAERKDPNARPGDLSAAVASAGIARTKDLKTWERLPDLKTRSQQRNVVLHPEFVNGKYALYTRPQDGFIDTGNGGGIGWALVDDICHAEVHDEVIINKREYHTIKEVKNGEGPHPIKTEKGWLHLAHGVRCCAAGLRYVLYLYMTSLEDPTKMIAEPAGYFMAPVDEERIGDVSNVLFSNGWIADEDGKVYIYYASSDTRMHVAESTVDRLVDYCLHTPADGLRSIESVRTIIAMVDHNKKILK